MEHKELKAEDFGMTPEEVKELVTGAQRFMPPVAEDEDDERIDLPPKTPIS